VSLSSDICDDDQEEFVDELSPQLDWNHDVFCNKSIFDGETEADTSAAADTSYGSNDTIICPSVSAAAGVPVVEHQELLLWASWLDNDDI